MEGESSNLILRETIVAQDSQGNVCLHDLWLLAGSPENLRARDWRRYKSAEGVISALGRRSVGITHTSQEEAEESIFYTAGKGRGARTFAHPVVALAYAEALNHDLAIETVRGTLVSRGIKPELLAPEEDLKKVERRHSIDAKKLSGPVRQPRKKKPG